MRIQMNPRTMIAVMITGGTSILWAVYSTDFCSDEEDETAELQRELEKIKRERAEKRELEVSTPELMCGTGLMGLGT